MSEIVLEQIASCSSDFIDSNGCTRSVHQTEIFHFIHHLKLAAVIPQTCLYLLAQSEEKPSFPPPPPLPPPNSSNFGQNSTVQVDHHSTDNREAKHT